MSDNVNLSTFPCSRAEALTMLYLKNQDLSNLSISEIAQKYTDVENEFKQAFKEQRKKKTTTFFN